MSRKHTIQRWWRRRRALLGCCALALAYWTATVGLIPTPALLGKIAREAAGEQYPCQGGRCGCASAHECWTTCRCKTMAQKIAWARRHNVPVPAYADLTLVAIERTPAAPACPLCVDSGKDSNTSPEPPACPDSPDAPELPERAVTLSPMGCKGLTVLTAFAVPPSVRERPEPIVIRPPTERVLKAEDDAWAPSRPLRVDPPPPKRRAA